ncbi:hypothetical protein DL89DRAFT_308369, partial [Linderina pennispora]
MVASATSCVLFQRLKRPKSSIFCRQSLVRILTSPPTNRLWHFTRRSVLLDGRSKHQALKYTYIVTGCFADWFLMPMYKWDLENHTVEIPGDGTITSSFTSRQDIARYTVAVLCRLGEFDNQTVRIASHTLSFNDWVGLVEKVSDRKFTVTYVPPEPIEEMIAED